MASSESDPRLIAELRRLGETYGPLGVALAAVGLTSTRAVLRHLDEGYSPDVSDAAEPPVN